MSHLCRRLHQKSRETVANPAEPVIAAEQAAILVFVWQQALAAALAGEVGREAVEVQCVDMTVSALEVELFPTLERLRARLCEDPRFSEAKVVSIRHVDVLHTIGLTCRPVTALTPEEDYSLYVNIIGTSGISLRGFVCWSQPFIVDRLAGYTIYEAMTRPYRLESVVGLDEFLEYLPPLFNAFERGIQRGRPPSRLRQFWNRIVRGNV
jgi:hypothetical protein